MGKGMGMGWSESVEDTQSQALVQLSYLATFPMAARAAILLQVPEILSTANSALSAKQLADRIRERATTPLLSEEKLDRLMQALVTCGLFSVSSDGRYTLNAMSKLLLKDNDGLSLASIFLVNTESPCLQTLRYLHDAVLDDTVVPFDKAFGQPLYQFVAQNPDMTDVFQMAMGNLSAISLKSILQRYRGFEDVKVVVDVGGATGSNCAMIVAANPHVSAINFDMPFVVDKALRIPGVEHRGGSMFEGVPAGGDAILLKVVLHNWDDESCTKILRNCYSALPAKGKVIIMEALKPEKLDSSCASRLVATLDLVMMSVFRGGKERSSREYEKLLHSAGFEGFKVALFGDLLSVMEAYKLESSNHR